MERYSDRSSWSFSPGAASISIPAFFRDTGVVRRSNRPSSTGMERPAFRSRSWPWKWIQATSMRSRKFHLQGKRRRRACRSCVRKSARGLAATVLDAMEAGKARAIPQAGRPTYCRKIAKEDGLIDWALSSSDIDARVRAFDPWPGTYSFLNGQRLNILEAVPL